MNKDAKGSDCEFCNLIKPYKAGELKWSLKIENSNKVAWLALQSLKA